MMTDACPDELLVELLPRLREDGQAGLAEIQRLLARHPRDAQLHFLHGSLLAAARRYQEARDAMAKALEIAPDYRIARFQLGFLAFTSGEAAAASETWAPLLDADADEPLRLFVEGLERLAIDDFEAAAASLRRGMDANRENAALNADMARLLGAMPLPAEPEEGQEEPTSLTQLALQQSAARKTIH